MSRAGAGVRPALSRRGAAQEDRAARSTPRARRRPRSGSRRAPAAGGSGRRRRRTRLRRAARTCRSREGGPSSPAASSPQAAPAVARALRCHEGTGAGYGGVRPGQEHRLQRAGLEHRDEPGGEPGRRGWGGGRPAPGGREGARLGIREAAQPQDAPVGDRHRVAVAVRDVNRPPLPDPRPRRAAGVDAQSDPVARPAGGGRRRRRGQRGASHYRRFSLTSASSGLRRAKGSDEVAEWQPKLASHVIPVRHGAVLIRARTPTEISPSHRHRDSCPPPVRSDPG